MKEKQTPINVRKVNLRSDGVDKYKKTAIVSGFKEEFKMAKRLK